MRQDGPINSMPIRALVGRLSGRRATAHSPDENAEFLRALLGDFRFERRAPSSNQAADKANNNNSLPPALTEDSHNPSGELLFTGSSPKPSELKDGQWITPQQLAESARQNLYAVALNPSPRDSYSRNRLCPGAGGTQTSESDQGSTQQRTRAVRIVRLAMTILLAAGAVATPTPVGLIEGPSPEPGPSPGPKFAVVDPLPIARSRLQSLQTVRPAIRRSEARVPRDKMIRPFGAKSHRSTPTVAESGIRDQR
jgi:hypothetical protein